MGDSKSTLPKSSKKEGNPIEKVKDLGPWHTIQNPILGVGFTEEEKRQWWNSKKFEYSIGTVRSFDLDKIITIYTETFDMSKKQRKPSDKSYILSEPNIKKIRSTTGINLSDFHEELVENPRDTMNTATGFEILYLGWVSGTGEEQTRIKETMKALFRFVFGNKTINDKNKIEKFYAHLRFAYTKFKPEEKVPCQGSYIATNFKKCLEYRLNGVKEEISSNNKPGIETEINASIQIGLPKEGIFVHNLLTLEKGLIQMITFLGSKSGCFEFGKYSRDAKSSGEGDSDDEAFLRALMVAKEIVESHDANSANEESLKNTFMRPASGIAADILKQINDILSKKEHGDFDIKGKDDEINELRKRVDRLKKALETTLVSEAAAREKLAASKLAEETARREANDAAAAAEQARLSRADDAAAAAEAARVAAAALAAAAARVRAAEQALAQALAQAPADGEERARLTAELAAAEAALAAAIAAERERALGTNNTEQLKKTILVLMFSLIRSRRAFELLSAQMDDSEETELQRIMRDVDEKIGGLPEDARPLVRGIFNFLIEKPVEGQPMEVLNDLMRKKGEAQKIIELAKRLAEPLRNAAVTSVEEGIQSIEAVIEDLRRQLLQKEAEIQRRMAQLTEEFTLTQREKETELTRLRAELAECRAALDKCEEIKYKQAATIEVLKAEINGLNLPDAKKENIRERLENFDEALRAAADKAGVDAEKTRFTADSAARSAEEAAAAARSAEEAAVRAAEEEASSVAAANAARSATEAARQASEAAIAAAQARVVAAENAAEISRSEAAAKDAVIATSEAALATAKKEATQAAALRDAEVAVSEALRDANNAKDAALAASTADKEELERAIIEATARVTAARNAAAAAETARNASTAAQTAAEAAANEARQQAAALTIEKANADAAAEEARTRATAAQELADSSARDKDAADAAAEEARTRATEAENREAAAIRNAAIIAEGAQASARSEKEAADNALAELQNSSASDKATATAATAALKEATERAQAAEEAAAAANSAKEAADAKVAETLAKANADKIAAEEALDKAKKEARGGLIAEGLIAAGRAAKTEKERLEGELRKALTEKDVMEATLRKAEAKAAVKALGPSPDETQKLRGELAAKEAALSTAKEKLAEATTKQADIDSALRRAKAAEEALAVAKRAATDADARASEIKGQLELSESISGPALKQNEELLGIVIKFIKTFNTEFSATDNESIIEELERFSEMNPSASKRVQAALAIIDAIVPHVRNRSNPIRKIEEVLRNVTDPESEGEGEESEGEESEGGAGESEGEGGAEGGAEGVPEEAPVAVETPSVAQTTNEMKEEIKAAVLPETQVKIFVFILRQLQLLATPGALGTYSPLVEETRGKYSHFIDNYYKINKIKNHDKIQRARGVSLPEYLVSDGLTFWKYIESLSDKNEAINILNERINDIIREYSKDNKRIVNPNSAERFTQKLFIRLIYLLEKSFDTVGIANPTKKIEVKDIIKNKIKPVILSISQETPQRGGFRESNASRAFRLCDLMLTSILLKLDGPDFNYQALIDKAGKTLDDIGQCHLILEMLNHLVDEHCLVKKTNGYTFSSVYMDISQAKALVEAFNNNFTDSEKQKFYSISGGVFNYKVPDEQILLGKHPFFLVGTPSSQEEIPLYGVIDDEIMLTMDERAVLEEGSIPIGAILFLYIVCFREYEGHDCVPRPNRGLE